MTTLQPRLGVVSYTNAQPLVAGLDWPMVYAPPAALAELLKHEKVDIALVPIVEILGNPDLHVIPGLAIGSKGPVRTVKFLALHSPDRMKGGETIQIDAESRTSALLLQIILAQGPDNGRRFFRFSRTFNPDADRPRLVIGDKAILDEAPYEMDLGEAWQKLTGLPFVYACWATLKPELPSDILDSLHTTCSRNLEAVDRLAADLAPRIRGWNESLLREYLKINISYNLGGPEEEGIRMFHRKMADLGLIQTPFEWRKVREPALP